MEMRLIDADATIEYLRECRCKDCDKRKGMKNGKIRFCYEIGDAPCRACDIGDTIDYFLDEDISPTIDAVPVVRCKDCCFGALCNNGTAYVCEKCIGTPEQIIHSGGWFCASGKRRIG